MFHGNKQSTLNHVRLLVHPTPEDVRPPELTLILAALESLPAEGMYNTYDDQDEEPIPHWVYLIPEVQCCAWDGSATDSFGYGGISVRVSAYGTLFQVWLGGSPLQSAPGFWVVPAQAAEIGA